MAEFNSREFIDFIRDAMEIHNDVNDDMEFYKKIADKMNKQKAEYNRVGNTENRQNFGSNDCEEFTKAMTKMKREYMDMADNMKNGNRQKQSNSNNGVKNNNNGNVTIATKKQISEEEVERAMSKNKVELLNEGRSIHIVCEEDYQNDYDGLDVVIKKSTIESVQIEYTTVTIMTTSGNEFYAAYDGVNEAKKFYDMIIKML